MRCVVLILILTSFVTTVSLGNPKQRNKSGHGKQSTNHVADTKSTNAQVAILKQQAHLYTVWVRRTLDDCKRDNANDQRFAAEKAAMSQDNQEYHLKTMDGMVAKKKAIVKEIIADLNQALAAYKVMHSNPLFTKSYLETERCFPDNFVPDGFDAEQLANMRFVELR